jgi:hypothetical protein
MGGHFSSPFSRAFHHQGLVIGTCDRLRKSEFCQSAKILKKSSIKMIIVAEGWGRRRATLTSFPIFDNDNQISF